MVNSPGLLSATGFKKYLLILSPPAELWNLITDIKKKFVLDYPSCWAWGKPHITLATFTLHEERESRILNRFRQIASHSAPIKVELRDFGSFPSHTIFINVITRIPIQSLARQISTETQIVMRFDAKNQPHFRIEPHLTIARRISALQFDKAWHEYSHLFFAGCFIANSMLLLKRPLGERAYTTVCQFPFENLPDSVNQGDLFG